jgi:hypothetical protein
MNDAFVPLGTAMAHIAVHVFRGGNRQIRTTIPPLARGVNPVIAWSGRSVLHMIPRAGHILEVASPSVI